MLTPLFTVPDHKPIRLSVHEKRRNRAAENYGGDGSVYRGTHDSENHSRFSFPQMCSTCTHMLFGAMGKQSQTVFLTLLTLKRVQAQIFLHFFFAELSGARGR